MKRFSFPSRAAAGRFFLSLLPIAGAYFLIELAGFLLLEPAGGTNLVFGLVWSLLLGALILLLPRKAGRLLFGISYFLLGAWMMGQCGYYQVFGRMMWLSALFLADEGAVFLGDTLSGFPPLWWICCTVLILLGALLIWKFPKVRLRSRLPYLGAAAAMLLSLCFLPKLVFWADPEAAQPYEDMLDAKSVYEVCGVYHHLTRDIWQNYLYPFTPGYEAALQEQSLEIDNFFAQRPDSGDNEMTGILEEKNVVLVLMESMDDWMITQEDTPTLYRLMEEGINFTNMYTPGYGGTRTLNSELCMNTGIYLPTGGSNFFNYLTNDFDQSIASQLTANGYTAEVFHYNDPGFYNRGQMEPAMGYDGYTCYAEYTDDAALLYDDCLLFDLSEVNELFFRDGLTLNTIITRSAHLGYTYNEVLSQYALEKYPEYQGKYGSEEEDCARLKAKLVDDMFARLLAELEANGQLENTVIIGVTDHYSYGYLNTEELHALSGTEETLLLENTPFFIWSADGPDMEVTKTVNTSDIVPTVLNLLGIDSPYHYLGQDAFDPAYQGYALFSDGSWICDGVVCQMENRKPVILQNESGKELTEEYLDEMSELCQSYIRISNLLLTTDYYKELR